jgi:two-component system KDP operon response regulator KdpE
VRQHGTRVLVVDDERSIRRFLATALTAYGYTVEEAPTGADALRLAATWRPELIILDLGLPDQDGVAITRRVREWSTVPIIVVSVREHEDDKVEALDAGADDYLSKPFGARELLARVRAALRRVSADAADPVLLVGDLRMDLERHAVTLDNRPIALTPREFDLLKALMLRPEKVFTHRQLLDLVWGRGFEDESHLLRVNVSNLRRKIETDPSQPRRVITEPGVGYRLAEGD